MARSSLQEWLTSRNGFTVREYFLESGWNETATPIGAWALFPGLLVLPGPGHSVRVRFRRSTFDPDDGSWELLDGARPVLWLEELDEDQRAEVEAQRKRVSKGSLVGNLDPADLLASSWVAP